MSVWKSFDEWVGAVKRAESGDVDPRLVPLPNQGPFTRGLFMTPELEMDSEFYSDPGALESLMNHMAANILACDPEFKKACAEEDRKIIEGDGSEVPRGVIVVDPRGNIVDSIPPTIGFSIGVPQSLLGEPSNYNYAAAMAASGNPVEEGRQPNIVPRTEEE